MLNAFLDRNLSSAVRFWRHSLETGCCTVMTSPERIRNRPARKSKTPEKKMNTAASKSSVSLRTALLWLAIALLHLAVARCFAAPQSSTGAQDHLL